MEQGLIDAELGGHVVKKRVAVGGRVKAVVFVLYWLISSVTKLFSSMVLLKILAPTFAPMS